MKKEIIVVGAGKIGETIADMLSGTGDYAVTVVDRDVAALQTLATTRAVLVRQLDIMDNAALDAALAGKFAVLSAVPFHFTIPIAEAAARSKTHYLDLTEDVVATRRVKELAYDAASAFIPQCGLAPGFISIVANDLANRFDSLESICMRVGALPRYPSNALKYNLTWSTDGLINEYCQPCEAIVEGRLIEVPPLEECEEFLLDGVSYEAFNTSGGLGTLAETFRGRLRTLNYRTIRYPGHAAIMKMLLNDLGLRHRRDVLKDILENALPATMQDVVVIFVTVSGWRNGRLMQETYANKIHGRHVGIGLRSAIQITTASGICAVLDMLASGNLPQKGLVRQEEIPLAAFFANRFGCAFVRPEDGDEADETQAGHFQASLTTSAQPEIQALRF